MKKISNTFELSGFIANDAQIRNFDTASVARFAISVSRAEKNQAGETAYKSALINIEAWRKNENLDSFDRLKKGEHITVTGYFKPEEWTGYRRQEKPACRSRGNEVPPYSRNGGTA